jgi:hypothetical protein
MQISDMVDDEDILPHHTWSTLSAEGMQSLGQILYAVTRMLSSGSVGLRTDIHH